MHPRITFAGASLLAAGIAGHRADAQRVTDVRRNVIVVSKLGGKCLDVEGGRFTDGTRVIGYPCSGGGNQEFWFGTDGTIVTHGKCLDAKGGQGRDGDQIVLWTCSGAPNQKWRLDNGKLVGINGKCIDLKGGAWGNLPFVNQETILYGCHGGDNQQWRWALTVPQSNVRGANVLAAGALGTITPIAGVIAAGGGNVVSAGGANVVSAGGGNVVAAGGLN
jgi:hypothetical protein